VSKPEAPLLANPVRRGRFFKLVGSGFGGHIGTASIDIVRHGRRRVANVERPGAIFGNAIADCHALVLSQMVGQDSTTNVSM
jgi:hypothetical protein